MQTFLINFGYLFKNDFKAQGNDKIGQKLESPLTALAERREQERLLFPYSHTSSWLHIFNFYLTTQFS